MNNMFNEESQNGLLNEELLSRMVTVNEFEKMIYSMYEKKMIYGTMHLCIGEEATCVGTASALKKDDYIFSTHRCHGQAIGKGGDINAMMAEMFGREGGTNNGKGGSMHFCDTSCGVMGANGIVGANLPIACGAAFTIKMKNIPDRVSVGFFGDGATNQGAVHEAMNIAAVWDLPIIFVLINNGYGMSTPITKAVKETDFKKRAVSYGILSYECDGNDVLEVYNTARKARSHVVSGKGPVLLIENTYRISGHSKSDPNKYRTKEEIQYWEERNPIDRFKKYLLERDIFTQEEINTIEDEAVKKVKLAVEFAKARPQPQTKNLEDDVYAL